MTSLKKHVISVLVMLAGSSLVFLSLYWMNSAGHGLAASDKPDAVAFEIERTPPKKPPPKRQKVQRKVSRSVSPKVAPTPQLGSSLSGISFSLPGFESSDLGNAGGDLLGAGNAKNMVMTEDAVDKKPVPRKQSAPEFPAKARQRGIEGFVKLNLYINQSGVVEKVSVLEAQPQGIFEASAVSAAQQWEFTPAEYNGNPVNGWFKRTVSFRLN
jgi:protein TonB